MTMTTTTTRCDAARTQLDSRSARIRGRSKLHLQTPFDLRSFLRILVRQVSRDKYRSDRSDERTERSDRLDASDRRIKKTASKNIRLSTLSYPAARPPEMELPVPDMAITARGEFSRGSGGCVSGASAPPAITFHPEKPTSFPRSPPPFSPTMAWSVYRVALSYNVYRPSFIWRSYQTESPDQQESVGYAFLCRELDFLVTSQNIKNIYIYVIIISFLWHFSL